MTYQNSQISSYQRTETNSASREMVLAFHCSGGNAKQWRGLGSLLGERYTLYTPQYYGTTPDRRWSAHSKLSLADEAEQSLRIIDREEKKVHLVGHSYGGALALHIALARPDRIASVSLYEPCAFHLLPLLGDGTTAAWSEISVLASAIQQSTQCGDNWKAMSAFVDYWNGEGAWLGMKPQHQQELLRWAPNANHAFDALLSEGAALHDYVNLPIPVDILQGTCSPQSVKAVSAALSQLLPDCGFRRLAGVGHMGPLTHADTVARMIANHVKSNASTTKHHALIEEYSLAAA